MRIVPFFKIFSNFFLIFKKKVLQGFTNLPPNINWFLLLLPIFTTIYCKLQFFLFLILLFFNEKYEKRRHSISFLLLPNQFFHLSSTILFLLLISSLRVTKNNKKNPTKYVSNLQNPCLRGIKNSNKCQEKLWEKMLRRWEKM